MVSEKYRNILVVDDEEDVREIIASDIEDMGYTSIHASSGKQALEIINSDAKIAMIVSDVCMPDGSGVELLETLKAGNNSNIPIIFITGYSDISLEDAYNKGVEALIQKPYNFNSLHETIKWVLSHPEDKWENRSTRFEVKLKITLQTNNRNTIKTETFNIGRGGVFIYLTENFPTIGDSIDFDIIYKTDIIQIIRGSGITRWVREVEEDGLPPGVGVEFIDMKKESIYKLMKLINDIKTKAFIPSGL